MRIVILALVLVMTDAAVADTFKFVDGAPRTNGENRCASPSAMRRLTDWVKFSQITFGHDLETLTIQDKSFGKDSQWVENGGDTTYRFPITDQLIVLVRVDVFSCQRGVTCRGMKVAYGIIQKYQDAQCYEQWNGHLGDVNGNATSQGDDHDHAR